LKLSQQLLESSNYPITQVAELAGFGSESVYRKNFKKPLIFPRHNGVPTLMVNNLRPSNTPCILIAAYQ